MKIDVFTLFPEWFEWFAAQRHVRNALELGHALETVDLRATTPLRAGQVDDTPVRRRGGHGDPGRRGGGGAAGALRRGAARARAPRWSRWRRAGGSSTTRWRPSWPREPELTLLCGRYEGFDERVHEHLATDVVSIGPYVLAGGELAAMVVCDAVLRKLPGALGHEDSAVEESFSAALEGAPEYPHYTRPFDWRGHTRAGDPALRATTRKVREWRLEQSRRRGEPWQPRRPESRYRARQSRPGSRGSRRGHSPAARYHSASRDAVRRSRLFYVRRHRKHRARTAAPRPRVPGGRPRTRAFPGRRGHPPAHPGLRGCRAQAPGHRRARDLHRAQAVLRRRRRAHVPPAFAEDRADRGRRPAATCAGRSSTTCASGSAGARGCASGAGPVRRRTRPSWRARCRRTTHRAPARKSSPTPTAAEEAAAAEAAEAAGERLRLRQRPPPLRRLPPRRRRLLTRLRPQEAPAADEPAPLRRRCRGGSGAGEAPARGRRRGAARRRGSCCRGRRPKRRADEAGREPSN